MRTAEELLDEMCKHEKKSKEYVLELFEELLTSHFADYLRLVSDDDLLRCVHDDRVMIPAAWMTKEDFKDLLGDRKHGHIKPNAVEAELNRRGLQWREYSDEERDCIWLLQHLTYPTTVATPEEVEEFRRLVKANGGNVPRIKFSLSERTKSQLEEIGLTAEWTRDDKGHEWVEIKGLKEAA
jgi:hypothetical protein